MGLIADQPFEPARETRSILGAAAKTAYKVSRVIGFSDEVDGWSLRVCPDRQWINPINNAAEPGPQKSMDLVWHNTAVGFTEIEQRAWFCTNYYSLSPGMVSQIAGRGAAYKIVFNDADGDPLSGDVSYKLPLPPHIRAKLFWSLMVYDAGNASGLATKARRFPSLRSRDKPVQNADRTTDLYIGPEAPEGKQANWLPTAPGRGFFAILRMYGPGESAIDYSWKPGDFEKSR